MDIDQFLPLENPDLHLNIEPKTIEEIVSSLKETWKVLSSLRLPLKQTKIR